MAGFLGTRASLMLDVVVVAMAVAVPLLLASIYVVRYKRNYVLHRRLQLVLSFVLLVTVAAFELEMRLIGWRELAEPSPWSRPGNWNDPVEYLLLVHLAFAIPAFFVWAAVVVRAWRGFANPPRPGAHSHSHCLWGQVATVLMVLTAVTGWLFYYAAFVKT